MSWAGLFSPPPEAKDCKGPERSASPQPGGSSQPPFLQRAEPRSPATGFGGRQFLPFPRRESLSPDLLWHMACPGAAAELPGGSRDVRGVFVFPLGCRGIQDKRVGINSNRLSSPAASTLRKMLPATVGVKRNLLCALVGSFAVPLPICKGVGEASPPPTSCFLSFPFGMTKGCSA